MRWWIIAGIVALALVAIGGAVFFLFLKGPDLSRYEPLRNPRISAKSRMKVIEVGFTGKPDEVLMQAFGVLFKTYFTLPSVPKGPNQPAPIARFKGLAGLSKDLGERAKAIADFTNEDWQGVVGLPVPEAVVELPRRVDSGPFSLRLTYWEYGEVAEILHVGSYETELPQIARLEDFIQAQGYRISGEHEEEYLRGPGMPMVKPESYYTIIRYPVTKAQ